MSVSMQFKCQKHFYFKLISIQTVLIQLSIIIDFVYTQLNIETVLY